MAIITLNRELAKRKIVLLELGDPLIAHRISRLEDKSVSFSFYPFLSLFQFISLTLSLVLALLNSTVSEITRRQEGLRIRNACLNLLLSKLLNSLVFQFVGFHFRFFFLRNLSFCALIWSFHLVACLFFFIFFFSNAYSLLLNYNATVFTTSLLNMIAKISLRVTFAEIWLTKRRLYFLLSWALYLFVYFFVYLYV